MKGLHWGIIVGLVVVVILLLLGSGIAGDIAKFTYTDYTNIQPGGGEGGGIIGGGGLPPSSDMFPVDKALSQSFNKYYDSEVGYSIATEIAEHFQNRGDKEYRRERCIDGYDLCLVGDVRRFNYVHGYNNNDPEILECDAFDEVCVTKQLANIKVGGASTPNFCAGFLKNDIIVKFGNNKCFSSGSDTCSNLCPHSDQIIRWESWIDAGQGTGGFIDKLQTTVPNIDDPPSGKLSRYFYQITYQPSKDEYSVRFFQIGNTFPVYSAYNSGTEAVSAIVKAFHRGFDGNYWNRRGSAYLFDVQGDKNPAENMNIAGFVYPEARIVANFTLTLTQPYPLLSNILSKFKSETKAPAGDKHGDDQPYKLSFEYKTCTNYDNCAPRIGSFKASKAGSYLRALNDYNKYDVHIGYNDLEGAWERELVKIHDGLYCDDFDCYQGDNKDRDVYLHDMYKDIVHVISNLDPNGLAKTDKDGVKYRIIVNRWQIASGSAYVKTLGSSNDKSLYIFKPNAPIYRDYSIQIIEEKL